MDIIFASEKFAELCNNQKALIKQLGPERARRLRRRLDDLRAATTLAEMRHLPGRCHELHGNRSGQFSLDLDHPYRLIFEPAHEPTPRKGDGGLDWTSITRVKVIGIEDTHE